MHLRLDRLLAPVLFIPASMIACGDAKAPSATVAEPHGCEGDEECASDERCADGACEMRVCTAGVARCTSNGGAVERCNAEGEAWDLEPCTDGSTCRELDGDASCSETCAAEEWDCDVEHRFAKLCSADGNEVVRRIDCSETEQICSGGKCQAPVCEPGSSRCSEEGVLQCKENGSGEDVKVCASGERCDGVLVACVARSCDPGAMGCLAETVTICNAEGEYEATDLDCAAEGDACWVGQCSPSVCVAKFTCVEGASNACVDNGTRLQLAETCGFASETFCDEETGACAPFACEPGLPVCNGDLATSCSDDGSHALDVGVDCTASGKVCWAAECLAQVCSEPFQCIGSDLVRCANKGTALQVEKTCGDGTVCDAGAETCRLQKCVPDQPACDGPVATTCDATGLGYTGARFDCSLDANACVDGACLPIFCEPEAVYCAGEQARRCGPTGATFTVEDTCLSSEFCVDGQATCSLDVCAAGAPLCVGDVLSTCKADGSGRQPGGTDCAMSDLVCDRGACRELICTPNRRFCNEGDVYLCNALGTNAAAYDNCKPSEYCEAALPDAVCHPDRCVAGGPACQGERLAQCNADGSGFLNPGTDCSASMLVCSGTGACSVSALDAFGGGGVAVPHAVTLGHFSLVFVATTRALFRLASAVDPSGAQPVTWAVYKGANPTGVFTRVSRAAGSGTSSGGYLESGTLDLVLEAGSYYLLGVVATGAHEVIVEEGVAPRPLSFGWFSGGFSLSLPAASPSLPEEFRLSAGDLRDDGAMRIQTGLVGSGG